MLNDYSSQIIFVVVMALLLLIVLPILQSRTGKSLGELFFGSRKGFLGNRLSSPGQTPKREPRINNGTRGELTAFISRLLRFANKNGMSLVVPGSIRHNGQTATLTALVIAPGRIIGIQCLGFGGSITTGAGNAPWNQHINGQDRTLDNPLVSGQKQQRLLQSAATKAGIPCPCDVVTVFTNGRVSFPKGLPPQVYTQDQFFTYLSENRALKNGSLDTRAVSLTFAEMAGIKKKKK